MSTQQRKLGRRFALLTLAPALISLLSACSSGPTSSPYYEQCKAACHPSPSDTLCMAADVEQCAADCTATVAMVSDACAKCLISGMRITYSTCTCSGDMCSYSSGLGSPFPIANCDPPNNDRCLGLLKGNSPTGSTCKSACMAAN